MSEFLFLFVYFNIFLFVIHVPNWGHYGRDRMVDGFTTTCAISTYHH